MTVGGANHCGHGSRYFGILGKCSSWHESSHFLETGIQNYVLVFFQINAYFYVLEFSWIKPRIRRCELITLRVKSMCRF